MEDREFEIRLNAVQELVTEIDRVICEKNAMYEHALTALVCILVMRSSEIGISKPNLLANISNNWEINDLQNEHPLQDRLKKIKY